MKNSIKLITWLVGSLFTFSSCTDLDVDLKSTYTESSLVSVAARLNYAYKERYMATVTMRTDGSSRFAKDNRWGWFPSAAVAWRASEEDFLKLLQEKEKGEG